VIERLVFQPALDQISGVYYRAGVHLLEGYAHVFLIHQDHSTVSPSAMMPSRIDAT
jgi:hypothetical protein